MEVMLIGIPFLIYIYLRIRLGNDISDQERDEALFVEGIELFNQEDCLKAFLYFDNVIKEYPKSAIAFFYRAKFHFNCLQTIKIILYDQTKTNKHLSFKF
jgi:hypothetical protein